MEKETKVKEEDLLVSMTDPKGKIIYANNIFCKVANYELTDLLGKPHNIVRHPDMPKVIFKVLWDSLLKGKPVNAFVKNKVNGGGYYWVRAFVMPVVENGSLSRMVSYRHGMNKASQETISEIYKILLDYEKDHSVKDSLDYFMQFLNERNLSYDGFLNRVSNNKQVTNAFLLSIDKNKFLMEHLNVTLSTKTRRINGDINFEVVKPSDCTFGKFISAVSDNSIIRSSYWKKLTSAHDKFYYDLQNYANGQDGLEHELDTGRVEIFGHLQDVIDNIK